MPRTPQELAAEILNIAEKGEHFEMDSWFEGVEEGIGADEEPQCCTTMCIAGWAAHLEGWDLLFDADGQPFAAKGRDAIEIDTLGRKLLDLPDDSLFYQGNATALIALRQLAEGRPLDLDAARAEAHPEDD